MHWNVRMETKIVTSVVYLRNYDVFLLNCRFFIKMAAILDFVVKLTFWKTFHWISRVLKHRNRHKNRYFTSFISKIIKILIKFYTKTAENQKTAEFAEKTASRGCLHFLIESRYHGLLIAKEYLLVPESAASTLFRCLNVSTIIIGWREVLLASNLWGW